MVGDLRFEAVTEATIDAWRRVHNEIIPVTPLSVEEVRERMGRNRLQLAWLGDTLVGCSTVRPPVDGTATATVIVRVLPEFRGRGIGGELYERELSAARELGGEVIETVVLETNVEGLRFAQARGYVEVDRYVLDGDDVGYVDLRLQDSARQGLAARKT